MTICTQCGGVRGACYCGASDFVDDENTPIKRQPDPNVGRPATFIDLENIPDEYNSEDRMRWKTIERKHECYFVSGDEYSGFKCTCGKTHIHMMFKEEAHV